MTIKFKVRYMTSEEAPHVNIQVFVSDAEVLDGTWAFTGSLTMRKGEFAAFRELMEREGVEFEQQGR
jgi:hypothetical protein